MEENKTENWTSVDMYYKGFHIKKSFGENVNRVTIMSEIDALIQAGFQPSWNPDTNKASVPTNQTTNQDTPTTQSVVCPKCGGPVWDNRPKKATGDFNPAAPDFKCKNKECGGVIWPPKGQKMPADGSGYKTSY